MASTLSDPKSPTTLLPESLISTPIPVQQSTSDLHATTPQQTVRYQSIPIKFEAKAHYPTLPQKDLNTYIYQSSPLPSGWTEYIHPDGRPYFRHQEWKTVTEANLYDSLILKRIEHLHARVHAKRASHPAHSLIEDYEIYLSVSTRKSKHRDSYYLVDHRSESIFWLEERDLREITRYPETLGVLTPRAELFSRQNYYGHLHNFPCHKQLPEGLIEHLRHSLTYICTDHITSGYSATSPWSSEEAKSLLDLVQGLPDTSGDGFPISGQNLDRYNANLSYRTWLGARLQLMILHSQIVHRYGLINARTDRFNSINPPIPSVFTYILGVLTFFGHITYTEHFKNAWADEVASRKGWKALLGSLLIDWSDANLLATVILSANMAFLALQNISSNSSAVSTSVVSTFLSVGSIVIDLYHVWRFRDKDESTPGQIGGYFMRASKMTGDLQLMSFFLCLPLSLLAWSIIFFVTSISIYAFSVIQSFVSSVALGIVLLCVLSTVIFFQRVVFRA